MFILHVNMYRYLAEICIIGNYPFIIIFSEQDGHAITKPMPIPTIDTSRTQVFGMSGLSCKILNKVDMMCMHVMCACVFSETSQ